MAVEIGRAAPEFSLFDADRTKRSLADFSGNNVVLAFFPAAFTGGCTTEMCTFRDQMDQFKNLNAQVLGISVDPPFSLKAWAEANNLNFPMLSDFNREAVKLYGVALENMGGMEGYTAAKRAVFVLDKDRVVRYAWVAPSPATQPDYDEIRQALSQLG